MPYRTSQLTLLRLSAQPIISWAVFDELLRGARLGDSHHCQVCVSGSEVLADVQTDPALGARFPGPGRAQVPGNMSAGEGSSCLVPAGVMTTTMHAVTTVAGPPGPH